jgi:DNA-binding transcriptional LysR family regulator
MPSDYSGLAALLLVAERRSFTAAAKELRLTPSAVSQTVRALEERIGVRLLQRTTRSVGLTEAGARFVARLRPALAGVDEAFESLNELRDKPAGKLRLTVPRLAYERVVEPKLAAFLAAYPEIHLDLVLDDGFANIVQGGFDAGIRIGEMIDREMIAVRVGPDERVAIVGSPDYFARHGTPRRPRDLAKHECINYRRITTGETYRWELTEGGKDLEIAVHGRLTVNDGDASLRAALAGVGLAHVLESVARQAITDGRLVRVLARYCPPFPGLFLYYPSRAQLAPKLAVLIDFLRLPVKRRAKMA